MKNKKLFAILTLVCFMFTLMPVAAFAAPTLTDLNVYASADNGSTYSDEVTTKTGVDFKVGVGTTDSSVSYTGYVFYAVDEDGTGVDVTTGDALNILYPGDYTVYAALIGSADVMTVIDGVDTMANKVAKIKAWAESSNVLVGGTASVTVEGYEYDFKVVLSPYNKDGYVILPADWTDNSTATTTKVTSEYELDIEASNGFMKDGKVVATLYRIVKAQDHTVAANWKVVKNQELTISKAGYVDVDYTTLKTDYKGQVVFDVTADYANSGNKVIVKYANAKAELTVNAAAADVAGVTVNAEPTATMNIDGGIKGAGVEFKFVDANGVATAASAGSDYNITVVSQPANSKMKANDFKLVQDTAKGTGVYDLVSNGYTSGTDANKFAKEGTYVIKVALKNGVSATATVNVAKQGDIVGIKYDVMNTPITVAYGEATQVASVFAVDANGVTAYVTTSTGLKLSADGAAVKTFETNGTLVAKDDEKYIGSKITVMAVYEDFVATTELTVVDKAATVVYSSTEAEVGINTTFVGTIMDSNGKASSIKAYSATPQAFVLEKPEGAVVVANAQTSLNDKGQVVLNFLANQAGEYKVQTVVRYTVPGTPAVEKYVSTITTFTVGGGVNTFDDVVVLSMGSAAMIVNDKVVALDVAPFVEAGRTMMQYTALEHFGITFNWDEATRSVTAEGNGVKVVMTIDSKVATVNGKTVEMEVAPQIINGRTVIPVTYATNPFGIVPECIYAADGSVADVLFTK